MLDDENQDQSNQKISFESLDILIGKWKDGTFSEIIDDWKWIFSYSKRYKGAIVEPLTNSVLIVANLVLISAFSASFSAFFFKVDVALMI